MARVTVEDCLPHIGNPFDLAMLAAERARQLSDGAPSVSAAGGIDGHKPAVAALREIATGELSVRQLREAATARRHHAVMAHEAEDETPEPPEGDGFERQNEAAIAADVERLPVAGTTCDKLLEDDDESALDEEDRAA
jgi:DNA-directed RNA polymerase subunit omega